MDKRVFALVQGVGELHHSGKLSQLSLGEDLSKRCPRGVYVSRAVVNLSRAPWLHLLSSIMATEPTSSGTAAPRSLSREGACEGDLESLNPCGPWRPRGCTERTLWNRATMALLHSPSYSQPEVPHPDSHSSCGCPPRWGVSHGPLPGHRGVRQSSGMLGLKE